MILSLIAGFMLGAVALLFALENTQIVALTFMNWQFETSLAVLVLASVGVGIVISLLASIPSAVSSAFRIMGLKKENKNLAQEVEVHKQALAATKAVNEIPPTIDLREES
jgi:uncharacterized integral membrane protein